MSGLSIARPVDSIGLLLTHKAYFWHLGSLLLLGDVFLTQLIIRFVPCERLLMGSPLILS